MLGKGHQGLCQHGSTCDVVAYVAYGCTESEIKQTVLWLKACGRFTKLSEKSFIQSQKKKKKQLLLDTVLSISK